MPPLLQVIAAIAALLAVAAEPTTLVDELRELGKLRDQGILTPDEFSAAKARIVGAPAVGDTAEKVELTDAVSEIMLGDKMAELLTGIFRGQVGALKAEIAEVKAMVAQQRQPVAGVSQRRRLEGGAVCTLAGCGDNGQCPEWNKELDNVDDCTTCANMKFSVNMVNECSCTYTCAVPAAELPPPAEAATTSSSDAVANVGGATVWLEDDAAKLAFGERGDVFLQKVADGLHLGNANFTVHGNTKTTGDLEIGGTAVGDLSVSGSKFTLGADGAVTLEANGVSRFTGASAMLAVGDFGDGEAPYTELDIQAKARSWGEGLSIRPSSTGYAAVFFRHEDHVGTTNKALYVGRDQTSDNDVFTILRNGGSFGGAGLHRGDAVMSIDVGDGADSGLARFTGSVKVGGSLLLGSAAADIIATGKKCKNTAATSATGVNLHGHCAAGNGGTFNQCVECVRGNSACSSDVTSWQPESTQKYCKCVAANDDCSEREDDDNYNVYSIPNSCHAAVAGGLRYDTSKKTVEFCDGTAWKAVSTPPPASCADALANGGSPGRYVLHTKDWGRLTIYCDFRGSEAWALAMLSNRGKTCPTTKGTWQAAINENFVSSSGYDPNPTPVGPTQLTSISFMVGLKLWNSLGNTVMVEMGSSPTSIQHRAVSPQGGFSIGNAQSKYNLNFDSMSAIVGSTNPGIFTTHNGKPFTTHDADNDSYGTNCADLYNKGPWWYTGCWSGSFWGGCGGGSYQKAPYWTSSGNEHHIFGALWLRF